jgi:hypothetical protein
LTALNFGANCCAGVSHVSPRPVNHYSVFHLG